MHIIKKATVDVIASPVRVLSKLFQLKKIFRYVDFILLQFQNHLQIHSNSTNFEQGYTICITVVDSTAKLESAQKMEIDAVTGCAEFPPEGKNQQFSAYLETWEMANKVENIVNEYILYVLTAHQFM